MEETEEDVGGFGKRGRRRAAFDRDWTKGSIIGNLLSLSWPMIINDSLSMLGPTIDMVWVGKLGTASMAGVGVSGLAVQLVNSARRGLSMGTRAMVARFVGTGDTEGANHAAQQAIAISAVFATLLAVIGIFFAEPLLILMGLEADVVAQGAAYLRIMFVGSVAMSLRVMTEGVMESSGDVVTPLKIAVFYRVFHVALAPILIFGWWIFPRLGVSGAALTNVIAQGLGVILGLLVLFSGRTRLRLTLKNFHLDRNMIWRIVRIGIPATVTGMERSFANLVMMWFVVPFNTMAVAAHGLVHRIEQFMHRPAMGMGMAAGVLTGQNLGARQPERAERTGWQATGVVTAAMFLLSVAIWFWAEDIVRIFNTEPELVEIASTFLRIHIAGFLVFGFASTVAQCLNGVGDTLPTMLVTLLGMWVVQVPLAFLLPRVTNLGVYGIRWAIVSDLVVRAVTYTIYFKVGRWKHKKV
ncbi:MATE family efflux transporter [Chloroflexota bacterium]